MSMSQRQRQTRAGSCVHQPQLMQFWYCCRFCSAVCCIASLATPGVSVLRKSAGERPATHTVFAQGASVPCASARVRVAEGGWEIALECAAGGSSAADEEPLCVLAKLAPVP